MAFNGVDEKMLLSSSLDKEFKIESDPAARYWIIQIWEYEDRIDVLTLRSGPGASSFCERAYRVSPYYLPGVQYLREAETYAEYRASALVRPRMDQYAAMVPGSISTAIFVEACKYLKVRKVSV